MRSAVLDERVAPETQLAVVLPSDRVLTPEQSFFPDRSYTSEFNLKSFPLEQLHIPDRVNLNGRMRRTDSELLFRPPMPIIEERLQEWSAGLRKALRNVDWGNDSDGNPIRWTKPDWEMGGSLRSSLFWGPKAVSTTYAPDRIRSFVNENFSRLVEADLRCFIPRGLSPHEERVHSLIQSVTGAVSNPPNEILRWNRRVPGIGLYVYEDLGNRIGLEFEISVLTRKNNLEIASYWPTVFTPAEREWQALTRAMLRAWDAEDECTNSEKAAQCQEARWRIVSGYGMRHLLYANGIQLGNDEIQHQLEKEVVGRFSLKVPQDIKPHVALWLSGIRTKNGFHETSADDLCYKWGSSVGLNPAALTAGIASMNGVSDDYLLQGLVRPPRIPVDKGGYFQSFCPELLDKQTEPLWVQVAGRVQELLMRERGDSPSNSVQYAA